MILGGMGPVGELPNAGAMFFDSFYALYSGITLLGTVAVILTPIVHRMLHALHADVDEGCLAEPRTDGTRRYRSPRRGAPKSGY